MIFLAQQREFSAFSPVSTKLILLVILAIETKLVDPWVRQNVTSTFFKTLVVMDVTKLCR